MSAQSYTLPEGSTYREALHQMGDAHQSIGAAQGELVRLHFASLFLTLPNFVTPDTKHPHYSWTGQGMIIYCMPSSVHFCLCFCVLFCSALFLWWCGGIDFAERSRMQRKTSNNNQQKQNKRKSICIPADKRTVNSKRHFHACQDRNAHDEPQCKPADMLFSSSQSSPCSLLMVRLVDWAVRTLNVWRGHKLR
jgi:hypothetical protein